MNYSESDLHIVTTSSELDETKSSTVDLTEYKLKQDHFDFIHVLDNQQINVTGAPNYRQVSGFPVFGSAQPTLEGVRNVLLEVSKNSEQENISNIIWFNMRQEPVLYINGMPHAPRAPYEMHENLGIKNSVEDFDKLEVSFTEIVKKRLDDSADGITLKIQKDLEFTENPMERENVEKEIRVTQAIYGFNEIISQNSENLLFVRVPVVEETAPPLECFDIIVNQLKDAPVSTISIFSCQMGRGRTTLGMVIACLVKEIKMCTELQKMADIGLVSDLTISGLISQKFESLTPNKENEEGRDPFINGEFEVIKELLKKNPDFIAGKLKLDRIIDICGSRPKGNGIQNLRECIIETKWKYDVAPEEKQVVWKQIILHFIQRYFYLICFSTYCIKVGSTGFMFSFKDWMARQPHLEIMIEKGKDKLEWYRQVDPLKLNTLKDLINTPKYKENLTTLIQTIYEFAFQTYSDLPRGPIKNNSMRKLAAKTLLEILPSNISDDIHQKLDQHNSSPDFVTLIGLVSHHGKH